MSKLWNGWQNKAVWYLKIQRRDPNTRELGRDCFVEVKQSNQIVVADVFSEAVLLE